MVLRASGNNRPLVSFNLSGVSSPVSQATLRLFIVYNAENWGPNGRTIDLHRVTTTWAEGDGANLQAGNLTNAQFNTFENRGNGLGVTWKCAVDSEIHNHAANCSPTWNGGTFILTPTDTETIFQTSWGWVTFDVTADVNACLSSGQCSWLLKKTHEGLPGRVEFATTEGAAALYNTQFGQLVAPQLVLNP